MGDNKRNSVAGKVATPKTGGSSPAIQPLADPLETLGKAIGGRIKVTTTAPHSQTIEGSLFTADPILNIVAINSRSTSTNASNQPGDYHIIPVSKIQNMQILSLPSDGDVSFTTAQPAIGPVDTRQLKQREEARIAKLKEDQQHRGKGVSAEGQLIYDALRRINMPVRWHNKQIIAHDLVIISAPYRPVDCHGHSSKPEVEARVKRVLDGERKKLKIKDEPEKKAAMPTGPRKGG